MKTSPPTSCRAPALICLLLVASTLAVFWQAGSHDFITLDDGAFVTQNIHVKAGLTFKSVAWAFTDFSAGTWHPLTWLSLMLDDQLSGLNAGRFHFTNLFFHLANTLLVFLVLFEMTGARVKSAFVAALFALHPLHVESVAWIAERKDVLSTFFWLLTIGAYARYVKHPGLGSYGTALFLFVLGLLSKPMLVTLPFVLLLLDYWPLSRIKPISGLIYEKTPFFFLAAAVSLLTFFTQKSAGFVESVDSLPFWTRTANALTSYTSYIEKMIWPKDLSIFYPYTANISLWEILASAGFIACASALAFRFRRKMPWFAVGWFWYLGTLVPVIGFVQVGMQSMADRYTYVPLIGLFIVLIWGAERITEKFSNPLLKKGVALAGIFLLSGLAVVSWEQTQYWSNSVTVFERALDVTSNNTLAHDNLGLALAAQGKTQEAIEHYNDALQINPNYVEAHNNLGNALASLGKSQEAMAHFSEALRLNPNYVEAHNNLGIAFAGQGKIQEAIEQFTEALKLKPTLAETHYNLSVALGASGNQAAALKEYETLKEINPELADSLANSIHDKITH